jgi:hypothetical protein
MKVRIKTWKMGSQRYLHHLEVPGGWFYVVTDSDYFSMTSRTILRNKVLSKNSTKETRGLKLVREREEELGNDEWTMLCFGGEDNPELRKKIYGKETKKIILRIYIYSCGRIDFIYKSGSNIDNIIQGHSVLLRGRSLKKRIKDPLPYLEFRGMKVLSSEIPKEYMFAVSELSWIRFLQKLKQKGWKIF